MKEEKTVMEVANLLQNAQRPVPIREFIDGLRKAGYIKQWEQIDDSGLVYKITFNS